MKYLNGMVHVVDDPDDPAAGGLAPAPAPAPRWRRVGLGHGLLPGAGARPAAARRLHRRARARAATVPHAVFLTVASCLGIRESIRGTE